MRVSVGALSPARGDSGGDSFESLVADSKNGGRVGLVLEGVPMNTLVGLLNELQGSARRG